MWKMFESTRMVKTGLVLTGLLRPTSPTTIDQLGRRQPDWILVSEKDKKIAIIDLCRPSDVNNAQLLAAAMRKQQAYKPLVQALRHYTEQGWASHGWWGSEVPHMWNPS
jgi:hypothetical protein